MKRFTKKYLMLLVAIVALLTVSMFAVSAEESPCDHSLYPSYEGNVIDPTCTTEGYTQVICGNCDKPVGRVPGSTVPAKGHNFEWRKVSAGSFFRNEGTCKSCSAVVTEKKVDANGIPTSEDVIYYAVSFYNPATAKAYDTAIKYTKVVTERVGQADAKLLDVVYVLAGTKYGDVKYTADIPICEKDVKYGEYEFIGWFYNGNVMLDSAATLSQSSDFAADKNEIISKNINLYAGFQGIDVAYQVRYYNYNSAPIAVSKSVPHGTASIYNLDLPTRENDVKFRYQFDYWEYGGDDIDLSAVYGDVAVLAHYLAIPGTYNIEYYYDAECTRPIINTDVVVTDSGVKYGGEAVNGLAIPRDVLSKEKDAQYVYEWTGRWVLANRPNYVVSLDSLSVPDGTPDALDGSSAVRLIPQYVKNPRVYELKVTVIYPSDDDNYHPEEVAVQVLYANGTAAGFEKQIRQVGENTYEHTFLVNYSDYYTIAATSIGYEGETISHFYNAPSGAIVTLKKVGAYSCGCICHTFLKPIWVRILNLLYTLFGVEHVCCSDMCANIGNNLSYGPGKTK